MAEATQQPTRRKLPLNALPQGSLYVAEQVVMRNSSIYDTWRLAPNTANVLPARLPFFQVPRQQAGSGFARVKTYAETNMKTPGRLERPKVLTVYWIIVQIMDVGATSGTDAQLTFMENFLRDTILDFRVDDSPFLEDHIIRYPGTGITGAPLGAVGGEGFISGQPSIIGRTKLPIPVPMESRVSFSLDLVPNANNTLLTGYDTPEDVEYEIKVWLEGNTTRPIDQ